MSNPDNTPNLKEPIEIPPGEDKNTSLDQSPSMQKPGDNAMTTPLDKESMATEESLQLVDWDGPDDPQNPKKYAFPFA